MSLLKNFNDWLMKPGLPENFGPRPASEVTPEETSAQNDFSGYTNDAWRTASLRMLNHGKYDSSKSEFGGTVERCQMALDNIAADRPKFWDAQPPQIRKHIESWFDYFESQAKNNMQDCLTQASKDKWAKTKARMAKEDDIANELSSKIRRLNAGLPQ